MKYDTGPRIPLRARPGRLDTATARLWADLRCQFLQAVASTTAPSSFGTIRSRSPNLRTFSTVDALLAYLGDDLAAELEIKSGIYSDLVLSAHIGGPVGGLAQTVLWLGLWPGLTAAIARRAWSWRDSPADLISEVTNTFTALVAHMDLTRVRRVIATLVRSTEREIIRAGIARGRIAATEIPTVGPEARCRRVPADVTDPWSERTLTAFAAAIERRGHDPAVQAAVYGLGARHIALSLGLKPAAARKRLERARKKLRILLADARLS